MSESRNIYDDPVFFEEYRKLRENPESVNILEEKPALFALSPDLHGKSILDLGCGYGENCVSFLNLGAKRVVGVDISQKMLEIARTENSNIRFLQIDMNDLSGIDEKIDVFFSSLAVHYIEYFSRLLASVYALLNEEGRAGTSTHHRTGSGRFLDKR